MTSQENKIVMESCLLSEAKGRGYRKRMLSLRLQKGMFWVSEQRLVDQANTIRRNSWMTEFETEELERQQGIFQGDSLSHLVFLLALIPLS